MSFQVLEGLNGLPSCRTKCIVTVFLKLTWKYFQCLKKKHRINKDQSHNHGETREGLLSQIHCTFSQTYFCYGSFSKVQEKDNGAARIRFLCHILGVAVCWIETRMGKSEIVQSRFMLWLKILVAEPVSSFISLLLVHKLYCSYVLTTSTEYF